MSGPGGPLPLAVLCGIVLGLGLWALASLSPRLSRPGLRLRVAPYVVDMSEEARALVDRRRPDPLPVVGMVATPLVGASVRLIDRVLGGRERIAVRLRQAGARVGVDEFRVQQLLAGLGGLALGLGTAVLAPAGLPPAPRVVLVLVAAVGGVVLCEQFLARAARDRLARIAEELPTVLEFMTLGLSAGEGVHDALRRAADRGSGELAVEFRRVVADVAVGVTLPAALRRLADELELAPLTRTVDQVVAALDRGSPLAETLRAQAADAREIARRDLLETAGKKEIGMMVPLVLLILPITVAFAVFPATLVLGTRF